MDGRIKAEFHAGVEGVGAKATNAAKVFSLADRAAKRAGSSVDSVEIHDRRGERNGFIMAVFRGVRASDGVDMNLPVIVDSLPVVAD